MPGFSSRWGTPFCSWERTATAAGYVPSACRGLAIPVLSNRPVPRVLCRVSVLYFQFHAMLLSTRVPIGSEPTIATLRESCVLGKIEENICLRGGKNLPTLVYMYKTIVSAWEGDKPAASRVHRTVLARVGT